ncbi:MAG: hypothetical protein ACM32E_05885 [Gemmatimonadota bacterium]
MTASTARSLAESSSPAVAPAGAASPAPAPTVYARPAAEAGQAGAPAHGDPATRLP